MNSHRPPTRTMACSMLLPLLLVLAAPAALAVPSFARQTGMACEACHTVWPELTHFGRVFKANGYVLDNLKQVRGVTAQKEEILSLSNLPPLSIMVLASYTQYSTAQPDGAGKSQNGTVAFPQQVGIFYAGKIAPHIGAFLQLTYGYDSGSIGIDNTDIRFADLKVLPGDQTLTYGLSLNNNPTIQDVWNSTPAFGFPYASSKIGSGFGPTTKIDGAFAQSVAGLTAYAYWNESLYGEIGVYRSAKQGTAGPLNSATPGGVLAGTAPYWRVAYEHNWGRNTIEAGLYGATFKVFPDLAGDVPATVPPTPPGTGFGHELSGPSDRYQDVAEDLQYQYVGEQHLFSVLATRIHEKQTLNASFNALTPVSGNLNNDLTTTRAFGTYYYKRKYGATAGFFRTNGSSDAVVYASNSTLKPDTNGWIGEFNYVPWLNTKFSAQYTSYHKYNGASDNYDGSGRKASDNNTLFLLVWLSY